MVCRCLFFFFSSRRRHTRCSRDWSSDVCSSDLVAWSLLTRDAEQLPRTVGRSSRGLDAECAASALLIAAQCQILKEETLSRAKRSEEHTSELQSRLHLVCRLLLEKKKKDNSYSRSSLVAVSWIRVSVQSPTVGP